MKKHILILGLLCAPILTSCASQDDVRKMQYQLRAMNQKMSSIQKDTDIQLQKNNAQSATKIEQLEQEISILQNKLEATNEVNRRLSSKNNDLESNITNIAQSESSKRKQAIDQLREEQLAKEAELEAMRQKLHDQQAKLTAIQKARLRDAERKAILAQREADKAKAKTRSAQSQGVIRIGAEQKKVFKKNSKVTIKTVAPVVKTKKPEVVTKQHVPTVSSHSNLSDKDLLALAMQEYQKTRYASALEKFKTLEDSNDKDIVVQSYYYQAQALSKTGKEDDAMYCYNEITRRFPRDPLASKSMLEQAYYFNTINEDQTVQVLCESIIEKFPNSAEANSARQLLKTVNVE